MGGQRARQYLGERVAGERRQALIDHARELEVESVMTSVGGAFLPAIEQRVLRAITRATIEGRVPKAWQLAADTDLTLRELERACDSLLARGLIGPPQPRLRGLQ